jgi:NAD+ synthase
MGFSKDLIKLDAEKVTCKIVEKLRSQVYFDLKRQGAVVGTSGGVDSAVTAALCVRAFGPEKVLGIIIPDKDNSEESVKLAIENAGKFGYKYIINNITAALDGAGCYKMRDDGFRQVFPDWETGWKAKIVLPQNILDMDHFNIFRLAVESPDGKKMEKRLPRQAYLEIVAASNMKQRMRMLTVYYHAEANNYAVVGTANKNEYFQGFFVKYGDGGFDVGPLSHLYKTQIFQLAKHLDIPEGIQKRTPSTETYPSEVSQEEFFFGLDFATLDLLSLAKDEGYSADEVAPVMRLTGEQVERVWRDLNQKQRTTEYLRLPPLGV